MATATIAAIAVHHLAVRPRRAMGRQPAPVGGSCERAAGWTLAPATRAGWAACHGLPVRTRPPLRPPRVRPATARVALTALALALTVGGCAGLLQTAPPARPVANRAFADAADPAAPALLWALGDADDGPAAARVIARMAASDPERILYLGDVYETGSPQELRRTFAAYGPLVRRVAPTPGNHDWPSHDVGYDRFWRSVTGAATPPWYGFAAGGWRILSLNSETPRDPGQRRFLRAELAGAPGGCVIAFWHRPRFSAGRHGDAADVAPLWEAVRGRAALVLNGHDHDLQRLRPDAGTTEIVAGAGGHGLYPVDASDRRLAFSEDRRYGAVRMALGPRSAAVTVVARDGAVLDRSTVRCARGPAAG